MSFCDEMASRAKNITIEEGVSYLIGEIEELIRSRAFTGASYIRLEPEYFDGINEEIFTGVLNDLMLPPYNLKVKTWFSSDVCGMITIIRWAD
jgi:hypothetical protein